MSILYNTYEVSEDEYELEKLEEEWRREPSENEIKKREMLILEEHQDCLWRWEDNISQECFLYRFKTHTIPTFSPPVQLKKPLKHFVGFVCQRTMNDIALGTKRNSVTSTGAYFTRTQLKIIFQYAYQWLIIEEYDTTLNNICWMASAIIRFQGL